MVLSLDVFTDGVVYCVDEESNEYSTHIMGLLDMVYLYFSALPTVTAPLLSVAVESPISPSHGLLTSRY